MTTCSVTRFARVCPLGVFLFMPLLSTYQAKSHVHVEPDGTTVSWYPKECCHDRDCQPVATVRATPAGLWMTTVARRVTGVGISVSGPIRTETSPCSAFLSPPVCDSQHSAIRRHKRSVLL